MWPYLVLWLVSRDTRKTSEAREQFVERFNSPDAVEVSDADAAPHVARVQAWVREQLAVPTSASFDRSYVRQCDDGVVRVAGMVSFSGPTGAPSAAGYIAWFERGSDRFTADLVDGDPVSQKVLPQPLPGGMLAYEPPRGRPRDAFWVVFWSVVAVLALLMLIPVLFG